MIREAINNIELDKFEILDEVTDEAKDLVQQLLNKNPEERISVSKALKHPWFDVFSTL